MGPREGEQLALITLPLRPQPQLPQLNLVHRRRCAREQFRAAGGLREGDHLSDRVLVCQQGDYPVQAEGDATQRRRSVLERLEQEPEALARLFDAEADRVEDL